MSSRNAIALDISRTRVRALLGRREGRRLRVLRVLSEDVPDDVTADDPEALGQWIGGQLKRAGISGGPFTPTTIALARQHVGLKRLTLPTTDANELPEMTRLAMQRQLPFDADSAVIDFVPVDPSETSTTVLGVAVPQDILDQTLRIAKAAKLHVDRVSLRGMGSALLLRHLGEQANGSILAVDVLNDAIEFCVIDHGSVRFSRSAELMAINGLDDLPDAVLTETRRTWMSYRIGEDSTDIAHAVIVGDARLGNDVVEPLSRLLKVDAEVLQHHPLVDTDGNDMSRVWPLAGLLLESSHGGESINFAQPRKTPDLAAAKRKRVLFAAALGMLVVLGSWTFAKRELDALERRVERMKEQQQELAPKNIRYQRDAAKRRHIDLWLATKPDWLEHLAYLAELSPPTQRVVLDAWNASADISPVQFDRRSSAWSAPSVFTISVEGEAADRATADSFRDQLVQSEIYATSSTGADAAGGRRLPYAFSYRLRTADSSPPASNDNGDADEAAQEDQAQ